jgi:hypothetical protein
MRPRTVIRSSTIVLGLLLMSLLLLYAANEYKKNMDFQWENMVQPHWEGVVPRQPLLLPLASEKVDAVVIAPSQDDVDIDISKPLASAPTETVKKNTADVKQIADTKTIVAEPKLVESAVKSKTPPSAQIPKATTASKKALHLRMKEDLYYGHTAHWEMKKKKVMPDFFAPKENQSDVQLGGHLIMEGDDNSTANRGNQNNKNNGNNDYLDAIQGAELNISIKMR